MALICSTSELEALHKLNYPAICITKARFTFLAGKSGSGKSTYLKLLNRTLLPSAGSIYYKEADINTLPVLPYRREVLLVPQEVFLFDGTILENFHLYCDAREKERLTQEEIQRFLRLCCADFPLDALCQTLSGGEKQRVFLAIYLSCMPTLLLLDEPTAALDEKTSVSLLGSLKEFCKENQITVLCVCHNDALIERFSEETIRLGGAV